MTTNPPGNDDDIDARFAEIMDGVEWDVPDDSPNAEPPDAEPRRERRRPPDVADEDVNPAFGDRPDRSPRPRPPARGDGASGLAEPPDHADPLGQGSWRGPSELDDSNEHFVPPDPEPLPAGDLHFWAILIGLTLGPVLTVLGFGVQAISTTFGWIGLFTLFTGFALLLLRIPRSRDDGDSTGGARV